MPVLGLRPRRKRSCDPWTCYPRPALSAERARSSLRDSRFQKKPVLAGVWKRRDFFTKSWTDDANLKLMADHQVTVVRGFGRIAGVKRVGVQAWGQRRAGRV
jgi:hypothetical protein